jgi:hypothetical protein
MGTQLNKKTVAAGLTRMRRATIKGTIVKSTEN